MTTLKSKIIRNFIAGILACVLVFSISITMLVTINYREMLSKRDDFRAEDFSSRFIRYNSDQDLSINEMRDRLDNLAKDLELDVKYIELDGRVSRELSHRNPNSNYPLKTKTYNVFSENKSMRTGKLLIEYNNDPREILELQKQFSNAVIYALIVSLCIGFLISLILSENISKPIKTISQATLRIKDGFYDMKNQETDIKEIENLQSNINYLSKNLKNQEDIRKQYAQDISHELRTPLTNLQLYIEAIRDGMIEADENTMDILFEEVIRLEGLVEGLKKTFDDNVEFIEVKREEFNLSLLIERIAQSFMAGANKNNIKLNCYIDQDVIISSDKDKFVQVLQNLISNAIKAIGENGMIDVYLRDYEDEFIINVVDDGIGISDDKINMIFERFYRIEDARNTKENGHGLGLSISKNFVEALGGSIKVQSQPNEGTAFTLTFAK